MSICNLGIDADYLQFVSLCVHLCMNVFQKKSITVSYSHHPLFSLSHAYITVIPKTTDCMGCTKVKKEKLKFAWNAVKALMILASLYLFVHCCHLLCALFLLLNGMYEAHVDLTGCLGASASFLPPSKLLCTKYGSTV